MDTNRKTALRTLDLIEAVLRDPVGGIGKPGHLKHLGGNVWSRRINDADRLVYEVFADRIESTTTIGSDGITLRFSCGPFPWVLRAWTKASIPSAANAC